MEESTNNKLVTKIDLTQLKIAICNVKTSLNKANKAGVFDLDEAKAIALNLDYLSEHYLMLEKVSVNVSPKNNLNN